MLNLIKIFFSYIVIIIIFLFLLFFINLYFSFYDLDIEKFKNLKIESIITIVGSFIGAFFLYYRSVLSEKQLMQRDEQYIKDSEFKNFLESTKLLTEINSTIDSKISALYLLNDLAVSHPYNTERIIQVLNQQIIFLIKIVNDEYCENIPKKQEIIEWEYQGENFERLAISALKIIKKISLLDGRTPLEYNTSIIFAVDTRYDKNVNIFIDSLKKKEIPTKNLIFLHCIFHNLDFSNIVFHYCKFINCTLKGSSFIQSNLWGTSFVDCDLENTNFTNSECEGVEFRGCFNLEKKQITEQMVFENKKDDSSLQYLIVISEDEARRLELKDKSYFKTLEDYRLWKHDQRIQ